MIRAFQQHEIRNNRLLDGLWAFALDPENKGLAEGWMTDWPKHSRQIFVPGCWNNEIGLYDYEGIAWYRTTFTNQNQCHIRLVFEAVLGQADVYVDGMLVGSHYGGFTPFALVCPSLPAGEHSLVVRTDNTHTHQTIPLKRVDWFHYGGISRSVMIEQLPDVFIERLQVRYDMQGDNALADITVSLRTLQGSPGLTVPLSLVLEGTEVYQADIHAALEGEVVDVRIRQTWPAVRRWDLGKPELYIVRARTDTDDLTDRIGFRTIRVADGCILLNDNPVYLQGVNRHEEHPEWGFAFPPKLMNKDLDIIQNLGCNSIRGSHYPQSRYWIDLLDERGIAYWSEIPLWQYSPSHMTDPVVRERAVTMLEEMVERDFNRPSVIIWSVHNEVDTHTTEGLEFTKLLVDRVRGLDTSRLVSLATDKPLSDLTLHLCDIIGINKYFGWYGGDVEEFKGFFDQFHAYAESVGAGNKPVIMSEFGGAGIFGDVNWEEKRMFSEDYQAHILERCLAIFRADPKVVGTFVWQFADIRSDTPQFRDRARGFNNKGIVNEYRKPKLAFRVVKESYKRN